MIQEHSPQPVDHSMCTPGYSTASHYTTSYQHSLQVQHYFILLHTTSNHPTVLNIQSTVNYAFDFELNLIFQVPHNSHRQQTINYMSGIGNPPLVNDYASMSCNLQVTYTTQLCSLIHIYITFTTRIHYCIQIIYTTQSYS